VPHLSEQAKAELLESIPAYQRDARIKGIPSLGSGLIFPIREEEITCAPFTLPAHWPRIIGLDFGWDHPTAAALCAWDRDLDVWYLCQAYKASEVTPPIVAAAVKPWGKNVPVAWPHDGLQHDKGSGEQLASLYKQAGLSMLPQRATFDDGTNGVEAGLIDMLERMQTGRFKVFSTVSSWFDEMRLYHRKDGKIVKERDDLICATRYALMSKRFARTPQAENLAVVESFQAFDSAMGY
jgi:hypothetical protein